MDDEFIDLIPENIEDEHLCCIIRTKKGHPALCGRDEANDR